MTRYIVKYTRFQNKKSLTYQNDHEAKDSSELKRS